MMEAGSSEMLVLIYETIGRNVRSVFLEDHRHINEIQFTSTEHEALRFKLTLHIESKENY
jgi:hypothetical protein